MRRSLFFLGLAILLPCSAAAKPKKEIRAHFATGARELPEDASGLDLRPAPLAVGMVSWYGPGFHGRRTANGERYNMHALTCASRDLPFGTLLEVTNLENGQRVVVRVNDRGPFIAHRILDLSLAAAKRLGFHRKGEAKVEVREFSTEVAVQERDREDLP
ncbi:MAG TPA: hypothetical protein DF383_11640 [Deltaproteobacteria bacterium]|nr:hypothetical protein [Deltaproteobacteria bacterium]